MPFSAYLNSKRQECKELVAALGKYFKHVSILGTDVYASVIRADRRMSQVQDGAGECGFVIKMHDGKSFFEYALDDISGDKEALAARIVEGARLAAALENRMISTESLKDEPMVQDFLRETDFDQYTDESLLGVCKELCQELTQMDEHVLNAIVVLQPYVVNKLFITANRELSQHYGWANGHLMVVYNDEKMVISDSLPDYACGPCGLRGDRGSRNGFCNGRYS